MRKIITRFMAVGLIAAISMTSATAALISEPANASTSAPKNETVTSALNHFNSLSKKDKKAKIKEAKSVLTKYKADKKAGRAADPDTNQILLVILAIFLPPLAVYLHENEINNKFWISLVLTILFWVPGVIYALLVVLDVV